MLPKSKYLPFFQENAQRLRNETKLIGDLLVVEKIQFPEKKVGSIIIADAKPNQLNALTSDIPLFFRVLYVGQGFYDETTGADVPVECMPGDVILTGSVSVKLFSHFPLLEVAESGVLGLTRFRDAQWHFNGEENFYKFLTSLNDSVKSAGNK